MSCRYCLCAPAAGLLYPLCTVCHFVPECLPIPQAHIHQKYARCCVTKKAHHNNNNETDTVSVNSNIGVYVVTGGNRGVGYESCRLLLQRGHTVFLLSRDTSRGNQAVTSLKRQTRCSNASIESFSVDLADLSSILTFVKEMSKRRVVIAGLLNNAGVIVSNAMEVNHLGHFALTLGLLPLLCPNVLAAAPPLPAAPLPADDHDDDASSQTSTTPKAIVATAVAPAITFTPSYVVNVSSVASWQAAFNLNSALDKMVTTATSKNGEGARESSAAATGTGGDSWSAYANSKAANALFSLALSDRLAKHGVVVSSYHPGVMLTDLWTTDRSAAAAASTSIPCCGNVNTVINSCCFLCIKQPCVSALGLVTLVHPRWCFACPFNINSSNNSSSSSSSSVYQSCCAVDGCVHRACIGSGGDYYQQCCCFSVCPVRAPPQLYNRELQLKLMEASFTALENRISSSSSSKKDELKELYALVCANWEMFSQPEKSALLLPLATLAQEGDGNGNSEGVFYHYHLKEKSNYHIFPSLPSSELLSMAPCCACAACVC